MQNLLSMTFDPNSLKMSNSPGKLKDNKTLCDDSPFTSVQISFPISFLNSPQSPNNQEIVKTIWVLILESIELNS